MTRERTSPIVVLLIALVTALALAAASPAGASGHGDRDSEVRWSGCFEKVAETFVGLDVVFECAELDVPLDYDDPTGEQTTIKMVRLPATDPANKIGSIFLNPGGPGGSGIDFATGFGPFAQFVWGPDVAAQFDIIGFDPRGIARSSPLYCFDSFKEMVSSFPPLAFPQTEDQIAIFEAASALLNDACVDADPAIADHMGTANVARDMDMMREAVGDDYLNYVGLSYGSYLGVTYANLFPDKVGALVVDGVLDPIAWANIEAEEPFSTRLRSDQGAQVTLEEFFRQCDEAGPALCALAPDSEARFAALAEKIEAAPVMAIDPFSGRRFFVDYPSLISEVLGGLYGPQGYGEMAFFLAAIEASATPLSIGQALQDARAATGLSANYPNFAEGFPGVGCSDTDNPDSFEVYFEAGQAADDEYGYFGSLWTWASYPCVDWELVDGDTYDGPYTADTAHPVLIIGNLYDPATRYEGAVTVRGLLPNSALITVDTPGHTSLGLSGCAGFFTGQYLLDPSSAPAIDGLLCDEGINWFDLGGPAGAAASDLAAFRVDVMDEIAFRP